jgi:hypothetical protein
VQHNDRSEVPNDTKDHTAIQTDRSKFRKTPKAKLQFKWSNAKLAANSDFGKQQASHDTTLLQRQTDCLVSSSSVISLPQHTHGQAATNNPLFG